MSVKSKKILSIILFSIILIDVLFPITNALAANETTNEVAKLNGIQRVHFINVKEAGNCTLIQTTDDNDKPIFGLIDAGRGKYFEDVEAYLDKANVKKLEFLLITHSHGDHIGGAIQVMKKYKPKVLYIKDIRENTNEPSAVHNCTIAINAAKEYGIRVKKITALEDYADKEIKSRKDLQEQIVASNKDILRSNLKIKFGKCLITVYNGKNWTNTTTYFSKCNENVNSLAISVQYNIKLDEVNTKKFSVFLGADLLQPDIQEAIAKDVGEVTIWQLAHHGYFNSFSLYNRQNDESRQADTTKYAKSIIETLNAKYIIVTTSYKKLLDSYARKSEYAKNGINTNQQFSNYSISLIAQMKGLHINSSNAKDRILFTGGWNDTDNPTVSGTSPYVEAYLNGQKVKNNASYITEVSNTLGTNQVTPGTATFSFSYGVIKYKRNIMGTDF